jgi:competence ComEA-like helix-hairpin-helix protein
MSFLSSLLDNSNVLILNTCLPASDSIKCCDNSLLVNDMASLILIFLRHSFGTFPQFLWKSLWKRSVPGLQVSEKFRLLAFCTHRLHFFRIYCEERFGRMKQRPHITGSLALLALIGSLLNLSSTACVKLPHRTPASASQIASQAFSDEERATPPVNINTASAEELERLPGIGRGLAARIISYREQYGRFRRAEHLIMVRGIGDRRFRRLRPFVTAQ